jgi:imidazolonepropionase-like amidohydrolase
MKAIIGEAHDRDRKVAAHAHGTEGIRYAILAGVDSIEHATFLDKETAILARENNVTLAMDIYNTDYTQEHGRKNGVPEANLIKDRETGDSQRNSFKIAVENNVNLVYATDSGVYPHGDNAKQFPIMVEYGMTPIQAIRSATIIAAELLDSSLKIGQIKPGYLADIIAVSKNPLEDITTFETITFVMKDGKIYKQLN